MIGGEASPADIGALLGMALAGSPAATPDIAALRARRPGWFPDPALA